jgi:Ras-related protein Rab-8A
VIVTYDITNPLSFTNVKNWLQSINEHAERGIVKVLVGNKIDLEHERKVNVEDAQSLASLYGMKYFETSAKLNKNIDELIVHMMDAVYQKMEGQQPREPTVIIDKKHKNQGSNEKDGGCKC